MPRLHFTTRVSSSVSEVRRGFTQSLFLQLAPPFPPVRLERFDGCEQGDVVSLVIRLPLAPQRWTSDIISHEEGPDHWQFVDQGRQLPFFLKHWHHVHRVEVTEQGSVIIDDITYKGRNAVLGWLLWPTLWLQFAYRGPVYRRIFGKP